MLIAPVVTFLFLPIYLWLRAPYRQLPLHYDTGFYVSNNTIACGRFLFRHGWNARFAACSKAIPEWFYSRVYLRDTLAEARNNGISNSYKSSSRLAASMFNFFTAICVGLAAWQLGGEVYHYVLGLIAFGLLSSEPQYGVYYECGELFALPFDVLSIAFLTVGIAQGNPLYVGIAAFLWAMETFFVKLSSGIAFVVLFGAASCMYSSFVPSIVAGGAFAALLFISWVKHNGRSIRDLFGPVRRHESVFGQRAKWRFLRVRLIEKLACLTRTICHQPIGPMLALAGALVTPPDAILLWYGAAVLAAYFVQATDCWYYQIPLLPFIALLVVGLAGAGTDGAVLLACGAALWLAHNIRRSRVHDLRKFALWSWGEHRPNMEIDRNLELEQAVASIAPLVRGRSMLAYGPLNQVYVLLGTSYDTSIITPEYYLDEMSPGWQQTLNRRLIESPPAFILDTGRCFNAFDTRHQLGLDYRLRQSPSNLWLYELSNVRTPARNTSATQTYRPQSQSDLDKELNLAGLARRENSRLPHHVDGKPPAEDKIARSLADQLDRWATEGIRNVAIYGAGRFTARHADIYRNAPLTIVAVIDDRATDMPDSYMEWPLVHLSDSRLDSIDAIVLSTDRFVSAMRDQVARVFGRSMPIFAAGDRSQTPQSTSLNQLQSVAGHTA